MQELDTTAWALQKSVVMPMDDQFRIRCDHAWKEAIEDVASRQRMKFADWVRQSLSAQAIAWLKEHDLPVSKALIDLEPPK